MINFGNKGSADFKYPDGLVANFYKVFEEFVDFRGLERKKLMIYGGKEIMTHNNFLEILKEKYDVKCYTLEFIVEQL